MYYRRMDLDVAAMISEVEARPALWDKSCKAYTDRHRRNTAWSQICKALYPDWSRLTQSQQGVIERDIKNRWKTVRDRFFKFLRNMEKDGTSIYPYPKCPFFEELLFLLPSRSLRLSGGTPQASEQPAETPVVQTAPQEFKMETIPLPIVVDTEKPNGSQELQAGSSRVATPSLDSAEETTSGAALRMTTTPMHSSPASRTAPTRGWGRKSLRATDRQLDVESEAMSLIRRADADDDCDFFGYGIAARCRQMSPGVRNDFMAYVYAAAAAFDSATTLPELGDMINHLRSVTGLKKTPHPPSSSSRLEVASISSQTDPFNLNAP